MEPLASAEALPHDYTLLRSWRCEGDGSYAIASRSIVLDEHPPQPAYQRGVVMPSGWLVEPHDAQAQGAPPTVLVTYLVQINPQAIGVGNDWDAARKASIVLLPSILRLHG
eukprot:4779413-Prymnesium_polylepis.1